MSKVETGLHYPLKLSELPESWSVGYVGDFAEIVQPGFASGKHNKGGAGIPHLRPMNVDQDGKISMKEVKFVSPEKDKKRLKQGDVLFNNTNSPVWVGKTAYIAQTDDLAFSNHMTRVVFGEDVSPKYGALQLHYLWMTGYFLHRCTKHVNQASISSKTLADTVPFVVPDSRDTQDGIVTEIEKQFSRLDEAVASLKRVKANLKRYKAAVLKAAVEGKLTEEWRKQNPDVEPASELLERILAERRTKWEEAELAKMETKGKEPKNDKWKERYKEPPSPVLDGLPQLPTTWIWASPEQLASTAPYSLAIGPFGSNLKVKDYCESGVPLVFVRNIRNSEFGGDGVRYVSAEKARELAAHSVDGGDILITKMGDPPGDACLYPTDNPRAIITADCIKWRLSSLLLCRDYFVDTINSRCLAEQIKEITKGVAQQKVSLARFRAIAVPLPPVGEQSFIKDAVSGVDSIVAAETRQVNTALKRAESLRQTILAKSFSAELTTGVSNASQ